MLFNSWAFFVFLPCVLALYYALTTRAQNRMLLVASYIFYGWWDWRFAMLLLASTLADFYLSLVIHNAPDQQRRKRLLCISLVANFGLLGFFKYFNFFIDSAATLLLLMGFTPHMPTLQILLPAGISFYTFQTMNYTIDVYRRQMTPTRDLLTYALFVSYFPHLVAGPIIRAEVLLPQLVKPRVVTTQHLATGGVLILIGLFKKIVIADMLAPDVMSVFAKPSAYTSFDLLKGLYFFSLQIYCDFAGYTDIARGVSRLLGIDLPHNFNQPYLSQNITEFWRRWHISLSSWLRDYLYIPLGGNLHGPFVTYRNLLLTMVLGGLWHGANWTFVAWGFLHGIYLVAHKYLTELRGGVPLVRSSIGERLVSTVLTFHLVALTWVFFRAPDFGSAFEYLGGMLNWHGGIPLSQVLILVIFWCGMLMIDIPQYLTGDHTVLLRAPAVVRGTVYVSMIILILICRPGHAIPFIYFQF